MVCYHNFLPFNIKIIMEDLNLGFFFLSYMNSLYLSHIFDKSKSNLLQSMYYRGCILHCYTHNTLGDYMLLGLWQNIFRCRVIVSRNCFAIWVWSLARGCFFFFWFKDEHVVEVVFKIIIVDKCDHRCNLIGCMCNLPLEKIGWQPTCVTIGLPFFSDRNI